MFCLLLIFWQFDCVLEPKERLIIKKIVVNNFKSYLGESTIGPFHKRFTAIVGPNGSGKSNLIESMLFVFGKKASWMRLRQLHELIYNQVSGTEVKKASVTVYFEEIVDKVKLRGFTQASAHTLLYLKKKNIRNIKKMPIGIHKRDTNQCTLKGLLALALAAQRASFLL